MATLLEPGKKKANFKGVGSLNWQDLRKHGTSLLVCFAVISGLSFFFYRSIWAFLFLCPFAFPVYRRTEKRLTKRRRERLLVEFGEMMNSLMTALKAGYSTENAMREVQEDMIFLYGKEAPIVRELAIVLGGLSNNRPMEQLLLEMGKRSGVSEIKEFAEVFLIAKRAGGNMTAILGRTIHLIRNSMEVEAEISVMLSSKKMESKIMDMVPFVMVAYVGLTSKGFFAILYHNVFGVLVMSVCLAIYLAAFMLAEKIVDIHV